MKRFLFLIIVVCLALSGIPLSAVTYTIAPTPYQQVLDPLTGNPVSGACIWTYTAGTSTPIATYSDSGGTTNSNPIQADSSGRFVAYLAPGSSYKFVYEGACVPPAHGTLNKTVDNISAMGLGSVQANDVGNCEGRITLSSGVPVTVTDVTAATTVYFTPYKGNVCSTYDPTAGSWTLTTFAEVSIALGADTTGKNYDLFGYASSGTFTLERLVWTNDTTRATALTTQDGVYVKAGQTSRRYLGTYRTSGAGQSEDSLVKRYVWNYYNRVPRALRRLETSGTWMYTTATWRQANGAAANQVEAVIGVDETLIDLVLLVSMANTNAGVAVNVGIGVDSTTAPSSAALVPYWNTQVANDLLALTSFYRSSPGIGRHTFTWLEISAAAGTSTWYAANGAGNNNTSGLSGTIWG